MIKDFISFKQALALKELGFTDACYKMSQHRKSCEERDQPGGCQLNNIQCQYPDCTIDNTIEPIGLPLFQQAFRWFREKHNLVAYPSICSNSTWSAWFMGIPYNPEDGIMNDIDGFTTYEEAELACLNKLIEIVKQKL